MARQENPPFERGQTYFQMNPPPGGGPAINDISNNEEAGEWYFNDQIWVNPPGVVGAIKTRTERLVRCRIVRNVSGVVLLPKRLVNLQTTGADGRYYEGRVDGYANVVSQRAYPLDEFLGATTGLPNLDLGWIIIEGPATVQTDLAALATNVAVGDVVVAQAAANNTATTAGRVIRQSDAITGAGSTGTGLANNIMNMIGRALSALTTGQTGADLLIDVGKY